MFAPTTPIAENAKSGEGRAVSLTRGQSVKASHAPCSESAMASWAEIHFYSHCSIGFRFATL
jgi:hypothetical protein